VDVLGGHIRTRQRAWHILGEEVGWTDLSLKRGMSLHVAFPARTN
jgi:hypothetical protein